MMKIQYNNLIEKIYRLVDEELELDTDEGREVFIELSQALFREYMKNKQTKTVDK